MLLLIIFKHKVSKKYQCFVQNEINKALYLLILRLVLCKMEFIKQRTSLPIKNVEIRDAKNKKDYYKHSKLLPNSIRCIICGVSNSGKTNVVVSLLQDPNGLKFENVYIYSRSLYQPKYVYLKKLLNSIKGIGCHMFSCNEAVIPPEDVKPNSIFIFDDVICDKQNNIRAYFCMGRHKGVDCFYLSQSYAHIPKHLIRENANLIVLFRQDDMNLRHVFNDFGISSDMTFDQFKEMCARCWSEKYGFLVVDIERDTNNGRYRKGFDNFICINKSRSHKRL